MGFSNAQLPATPSNSSFSFASRQRRKANKTPAWNEARNASPNGDPYKLVGGWTNPFDKYAPENSKWESSPIFGVNFKKYLKPPPSKYLFLLEKWRVHPLSRYT